MFYGCEKKIEQNRGEMLVFNLGTYALYRQTRDPSGVCVYAWYVCNYVCAVLCCAVLCCVVMLDPPCHLPQIAHHLTHLHHWTPSSTVALHPTC